MIYVLLERSGDNLQVAWIYETEAVAKNMWDRLFEHQLLIDYDVMGFETYWELNYYLQSELILPDNEDDY